MHFSRRTNWTHDPNPLSDAWDRRRASGSPCVDLTLSNPTQAGFTYPEREILAAIASPRSLVYAPEPLGLLAAREAVARLSGAAPGDIVLTASSSEAYGWIWKLLTERDDHVLVPRPSYPLLEFIADLEEVRLDPYPLRYEGRWRIDLDAFEAAITPRTRAAVLIHPNNPTGNFAGARERATLLEICARKGVALVSDEVFLDFGRDEGAPHPSLASGEPDALVFALGGLSKSAGLPQLKLGWIRVAGPRRLRSEAVRRLEVLADTYLSVNTQAQIALPRLLELRETIRRQIQTRTARNLAALASMRPTEAAWDILDSEGGWSAVLRVPETLSEEDRVVRLVEEQGVLVHPGFFFDFETGAHLVVSLLPPEETFSRGARALGEALDSGG